MKRTLIIIAFILLIWFGYSIISNGFTNDSLNLDVASYETIEKKSNSLTKVVAAYNKKKDNDYKSAISSLNDSIKSYQESKEKYEEVLEEIGTTTEQTETEEEVLALSKKVYEVDFLLTTLGLYAEKEGVDVTFDVVKGSSSSFGASGAGYVLCNLKFSVLGQYIDIANFLGDLEGDDELSFEIRDYNMVASGNGEKSEFTVYNIPINSSTLIDSVTSSSYQTNYDDSNDEYITGNSSSVTASNTTNTTNTSNTTNTQSNSNSYTTRSSSMGNTVE